MTTPDPTPTCPSRNVTARSPGSRLITSPCTRPAGHHGPCADKAGTQWTRLGEHLRTRGIPLRTRGIPLRTRGIPLRTRGIPQPQHRGREGETR